MQKCGPRERAREDRRGFAEGSRKVSRQLQQQQYGRRKKHKPTVSATKIFTPQDRQSHGHSRRYGDTNSGQKPPGVPAGLHLVRGPHVLLNEIHAYHAHQKPHPDADQQRERLGNAAGTEKRAGMGRGLGQTLKAPVPSTNAGRVN